MIIFTLKMYNNDWTQREPNKLFAKVRPFKLAGHVFKGTYSYTFEEGNTAQIEVRESTDNKEPDIIRKKSNGFFGCDWMIDEIIQFGEIRSREERREATPLKEQSKESIQEEIEKLKEELLQIKRERNEINARYNDTNMRLARRLNHLKDPNN